MNEKEKSPWRDRSAVACIVVLLAVGAVLRFHRIGEKSYWLDEAITIDLADKPMKTMYRELVSMAVHPPFPFLLLQPWMRVFGTTEAATRAQAAVFDLMCIPLVYFLGRRLFTRGTGLLAALIFTISPFHMYFSQEQRSYSLLCLMGLAATVFLVVALGIGASGGGGSSGGATKKSGAWSGVGNWALFGLFCALTMHTHHCGAFLVAALHCFVIGWIIMKRQGLRGYLVSFAVTSLVMLPLVPLLLTQATRVIQDYWLPNPTLQTVLSGIADLSCGYASSWLGCGLSYSTIFIPVVFVAFGLIGAAAAVREPRPLLLALAVVVLPVAFELLVSIRRPLFYTRTLIFITPALYVLFARGVLALKSRALIAGATLMLCIFSSLGIWSYYNKVIKEDWRGAVGVVANGHRPGDLVVLESGFCDAAFNNYWRRTGKPVTLVPLPFGLYADELMGSTKIDEANVNSFVAKCLERRDRVWLVLGHELDIDPNQMLRKALEKRMYCAGDTQLHCVRVMLFLPDRPGGASRQATNETGQK